jgi:hypothetical protein
LIATLSADQASESPEAGKESSADRKALEKPLISRQAYGRRFSAFAISSAYGKRTWKRCAPGSSRACT